MSCRIIVHIILTNSRLKLKFKCQKLELDSQSNHTILYNLPNFNINIITYLSNS